MDYPGYHEKPKKLISASEFQIVGEPLNVITLMRQMTRAFEMNCTRIAYYLTPDYSHLFEFVVEGMSVSNLDLI